jgi:hypothetical protein
MSLAVVVPVPLDGGGAAKAGTLLREAIDKVNKGEVRRRSHGRTASHRRDGRRLGL